MSCKKETAWIHLITVLIYTGCSRRFKLNDARTAATAMSPFWCAKQPSLQMWVFIENMKEMNQEEIFISQADLCSGGTGT